MGVKHGRRWQDLGIVDVIAPDTERVVAQPRLGLPNPSRPRRLFRQARRVHGSRGRDVPARQGRRAALTGRQAARRHGRRRESADADCAPSGSGAPSAAYYAMPRPPPP